jgi:hypothetical protein
MSKEEWQNSPFFWVYIIDVDDQKLHLDSVQFPHGRNFRKGPPR